MRYLRKTMKEMKQILSRLLRGSIAIVICWVSTPVISQILEPVSWDFALYETEVEGEVELVFHASVEPCWHIYSQFLDDLNGPLPTYF